MPGSSPWPPDDLQGSVWLIYYVNQKLRVSINRRTETCQCGKVPEWRLHSYRCVYHRRRSGDLATYVELQHAQWPGPGQGGGYLRSKVK